MTLDVPHFVSIISNSDYADGLLELTLYDEASNIVETSAGGYYGFPTERAVQAFHVRLSADQEGAQYFVRARMLAGPGGLPYRITFLTMAEG